jgi:hypothetical protein
VICALFAKFKNAVFAFQILYILPYPACHKAKNRYFRAPSALSFAL